VIRNGPSSRLDYIRADRGDITAEVIRHVQRFPTGGLAHVARVNLLSSRQLASTPATSRKRAPSSSTDWQQLLFDRRGRDLCRRFRRGEPATLLRDIAPAEDGGYIVRGAGAAADAEP
jgi:hypothetical protein